jgi:hypothetical protein
MLAADIAVWTVLKDDAKLIYVRGDQSAKDCQNKQESKKRFSRISKKTKTDENRENRKPTCLKTDRPLVGFRFIKSRPVSVLVLVSRRALVAVQPFSKEFSCVAKACGDKKHVKNSIHSNHFIAQAKPNQILPPHTTFGHFYIF